MKNYNIGIAHFGRTDSIDVYPSGRPCPLYPHHYKQYFTLATNCPERDIYVEMGKMTMQTKCKFKNDDEENENEDICTNCSERDQNQMIICCVCYRVRYCLVCFHSNKDAFVDVNKELNDENANAEDGITVICKSCSETLAKDNDTDINA